jgi:hypothetical protein
MLVVSLAVLAVRKECRKEEVSSILVLSLLLYSIVGWGKIAEKCFFLSENDNKINVPSLVFYSLSLSFSLFFMFIREEKIKNIIGIITITVTAIPLSMFTGKLFWENVLFLNPENFLRNFLGEFVSIALFLFFLFLFLIKKRRGK